MRLLLEIGADAPPERAEEVVRAKLARKEKIPGFGHRVYHTEDPRATHLRQMSRDLGQRAGQPSWFEMSQRIEALVKAEKKLNPNVDFYSASTYYALGIPIDLFTPIFAVSRISGLDGARARAVREQPPDPARAPSTSGPSIRSATWPSTRGSSNPACAAPRCRAFQRPI